MNNWLKCSEVPPPKDRLIFMSTGIAWYREDESHTNRQGKTKIIKQLRHSGIVELVYWYSEEEALKNKTIKHEYWVKFGGGGFWLDGSFDYWAEFENPLTLEGISSIRDSTPFDVSPVVPCVDDMVPIEYTSEDKEQLKLAKALFG